MRAFRSRWRSNWPGMKWATFVDLGWSAIKNGRLLSLVEGEGFRLFITCDKNMDYQQPLRNRPFAIIIVSTNHCPTMRSKIEVICKAVEGIRPGSVAPVDCGAFVPSKFRRQL